MTTECRLCGIAHDPQLHAAVLRIRAWVRARLALVLQPVAIPPQPRLKPYPPGMAAIRLLRCPASKRKAAAK